MEDGGKKYLDSLSPKERRKTMGVLNSKRYERGEKWEKVLPQWKGLEKHRGRLDEDRKKITVEEAWKLGYNSIYRHMNRKEANIGEFSKLEIPMQKRVVKAFARTYNIDLKEIKIKIQRNEELLNLNIAGATDPNNIGRIDLFPNAFKNEEELLRTLVHEREHVRQLRKYGKQYTQSHLYEMEKDAYKKEEQWIKKYYRKK